MSGPWEDFQQPAQADGPWQAYQNQPPPEPPQPQETPEAFKNRLRAGSYLTGDIGAALPEATADFSKTFIGMQLKGAWDMFTLPGRVMSGETRLDTPQGLNEAIGMGVGIALGRMNEMPGNGAGAPVIDQGGGRFARPIVDDAGRPQVAPIGALPTAEDFGNAAKVLNQETVSSAAVRFNDKIYTGSNHLEAMEKAAAEHGTDVENLHTKADDNKQSQLDSWVTSTGRFVDSKEAARIVNSPHDKLDSGDPEFLKQRETTEANLKQMWQQDGIHPAEAVHDAQTDAFLKHDMVTKQDPVKLEPETAELLDLKPRALSASASDDIPLVSPDVQPLSQPGSLVAAGRKAAEDFNGLMTNIQYLLDPMSTGSNRAMVIAKDAMNSVRRIRWDHLRTDADIVSKFDPDRRAYMWGAADSESVALQTGEVAHEGLVELDPAERAYVERLHADAQTAWLHAVDAGQVEGEGLPAYTPRMVMNVAAAGNDLGPRALNELGRNVFTRTSQMLHRGNLTAEETESAAQELVRSRMAQRGASQAEIDAAVEKVKIARDIRSLPLATARLQESTVWREMINKVDDVGKATGEQHVSVGHKPADGWFTIAGNPAFTKWEPILEKVNGKWVARVDNQGNTIMAPKPIYMSPEFRGPMNAILDEGNGVTKAIPGAPSLYEGLMALKGRAMTAILNSPLIHNEVVWSKAMEAAGGREWLGFGLYFRGNRIVNNVGRSSELIERGLNPMGPRGSFQDITGMMEQPDIMRGYHESWTGKLLGAVPGLFDPAAGVAVERAIAKTGNFVHNTLLWDRVRDLQFGLADHLSDRLVGKGADRLTADRIATHFSNIIVGSIPKEAMSAGARATANMLLFSRSFTLGNLSTFKQAAMGLPKPILAQIERDFGISAEEAIPGEAAAEASKIASGIARRKAVSTIALSAGLYYVGNALIQHAVNLASRDSSINEELQGYARRYKSLMSDASRDPFELRHLISRLSPTYDNEPGKSDRAFIGNDPQGTGLYARNPTGKFGEEMVGYPTKPMTMLRQKLSPLASGILDILENDKGFGQKIYDENDTSLKGDIQTAFAVAKHLVMKHLPEGQLMGGLDLLRGDGDKRTNILRLTGPMLGFTVSRGYPGGPARGEVKAEDVEHETQFSLQWPDIKKQIQRGDTKGAQAAMDALKLAPYEQSSLTRAALDPASNLRGRTLQNFLRRATPEQRARFDRAKAGTPPPQ